MYISLHGAGGGEGWGKHFIILIVRGRKLLLSLVEIRDFLKSPNRWQECKEVVGGLRGEHPLCFRLFWHLSYERTKDIYDIFPAALSILNNCSVPVPHSNAVCWYALKSFLVERFDRWKRKCRCCWQLLALMDQIFEHVLLRSSVDNQRGVHTEQSSGCGRILIMWLKLELWVGSSAGVGWAHKHQTVVRNFKTQNAPVIHYVDFLFVFVFLALVAFYWQMGIREDTQQRVAGKELNLQPLQEDRSLCTWVATTNHWTIRWPNKSF